MVILEKMKFVGGTTARSGGVMWMPNNPFMKRDGVEDSLEKAMTYLDNTVGDHDDTPGATRERRYTYLTQAPRMVDFLIRQGIKLTRQPYWPDYYDDRPGGSAPGRTVIAEYFNANELGEWREKLQPGFHADAGRHDRCDEYPLHQAILARQKMVRHNGLPPRQGQAA